MVVSDSTLISPTSITAAIRIRDLPATSWARGCEVGPQVGVGKRVTGQLVKSNYLAADEGLVFFESHWAHLVLLCLPARPP